MTVALPTGVEEYHQIIWTFENKNIAQCRENANGTQSCEVTDEGLRDRLKMDSQTGSLTIMNISTELTGLYKLQIIDKSSKKSSNQKFNVTISGK
ncbi:SLAM family member 9 [Labeo rohita]|uniref:SLAM family member 9 n=1 Tax=Labeo rohita TaxID=84645 RepID=A0ABQ8LHN8_LABRO|nr:SLAM family member 9 [Labeo rohita]